MSTPAEFILRVPTQLAQRFTGLSADFGMTLYTSSVFSVDGRMQHRPSVSIIYNGIFGGMVGCEPNCKIGL